MNSTMNLRLQHLLSAMEKDLTLINEIEDAVRYEDDPRRRAKYRKDILELQDSVSRHKEEYSDLQKEMGNMSVQLHGVYAQLRQLDKKLDALLLGQDDLNNNLADLQSILLKRYDASEQRIIGQIIRQLNAAQLDTVQAIVDAVDKGELENREMLEVTREMDRHLQQLQQRDVPLPIEAEVIEAISSPTLDVKHKVKVSIPIIPLILNYEGEVGLGSGLDLESLWKKLIQKVRGR